MADEEWKESDEEEIDEEYTDDEEDVYDKDDLEELKEEDELDDAEQGFMKGYDEAAEEAKEKRVDEI